MYVARTLDMTGGVTLTGRQLIVESVLVGDLAFPGYMLTTRCRGTIRMLHFQADLLCKVECRLLAQ